VPFAGHPTLGAAYVLAVTATVALTGERTDWVFDEGVGPVPVTVQAREDTPDQIYLTAAQAPVVGPPPPDRATLAGILSLAEADLDSAGWEPAAVSCGMPFLLVPVRDRAALRRAALNRTAWDQALRAFWAPHLYVIYLEPDRSAPIQARMFAPALGIDEDPATGAAAVTLAGYLGARHPQTEGVLHWTVEQGVDLGRPSRLLVEADRRQGQVVAARVGGQAVLVSEGIITVPDPVGATGITA
jgi:trans-2,3-dihydro-3-hydroxyanthranilate isomerase